MLATLTLLLAACASDEPAPVEDRSQRSSSADLNAPAPVIHETTGGMYRVQAGDTLYAIAFNHGVDYRDLAAWNQIDSPYRIRVGQELRLDAPQASQAQPVPGAAVTMAAPESAAAATVTPLAAASAPPPAQKPVPPPKPVAQKPAPAPVAQQAAPVPTPAPSAATEAPVAAAAAAAGSKASPAPQLSAGGVNWRWPAEGNVIGTYVTGDQTRQGVDIAGKEGDPVVATADGDVVYSGNGLIGYGELVIIKHNASFLSAYGHNRKRLVQEGDHVKAGQRIAEMGASAAARDELHFEIRKNGKPVNPLDYLPVR